MIFGGGVKEYDVNIQSQTMPKFQYFAMQEIKTDIALTADVPADSDLIPVSAGHGFNAATVGEKISIFDGETFIQSDIKSVATNNIGIYTPTDRPLSKDTAIVVRGNSEVAVDASTPIDFLWKPRGATVPIDISKVVITIFAGAQLPDSSKFGGAAALTNGIYFRHVDGERNNLGNYRLNRDFEDLGGKVDIGTKGPGGTNSVIITFDMEQIFGQVERFFPANNDMFLAKGRDNMNITGLDSMTISLIGSYTSGE